MIEETNVLVLNHYKIFFHHELMKKIELIYEYHFVIHYVIELDNDDEHYFFIRMSLFKFIYV